MTKLIGVEPDCPFSPGMLKKIAYAGTQASSFVQAAQKPFRRVLDAIAIHPGEIPVFSNTTGMSYPSA